MPTQGEKNQFRRLIGTYGQATPAVGSPFATPIPDEVEVESWLNDTTYELTGDFATPLDRFDDLPTEYHSEVIYKAAINYWWEQVAFLQQKHSTSIGQAAQNVGEKWDRAFQMVQSLQTYYDEIQALGIDIYEGNFSRFSKTLLQRIGGVREESDLKSGQ